MISTRSPSLALPICISIAIRLAVLCDADDAPIGFPEARRWMVQGCQGTPIAAPGGGFAGLMFFALPTASG